MRARSGKQAETTERTILLFDFSELSDRGEPSRRSRFEFEARVKSTHLCLPGGGLRAYHGAKKPRGGRDFDRDLMGVFRETEIR